MTVTLVTGASSGIGEATALHFARLGHAVYASMRTPDVSGGALRSAAEEGLLDLEVIALDVDDSASVASAVDGVIERSGRIDVLVNNAGLLTLTSVEEVPLEEAQALFETNVFGPLRMMQAVLPAMRERGSGTIVNISSRRGTPRECRPWDLRRDQVRPGGFERGGRHRNEAARDPSHRDRSLGSSRRRSWTRVVRSRWAKGRTPLI